MNKANIVYKRNSIKKSEKLKQSGSFVKYTSFDWTSVNKGDIIIFIQLHLKSTYKYCEHIK